MRLSWAKGAFVLALSAIVMAPLTSAMAQQGSDVHVSVNLKDADMLTATRVLTSKTGIQFVVEPTTVAFGRITLQVSEVTAEDAIRYICQAAGASFRRDENGVYIIGHEKRPPIEPPAAAPSKVPKLVRKIKVLKADVRDVYGELMFHMEPSTTRGFEDLEKFVHQSRADGPSSYAPSISINGNPGQTALPNLPASVPLTNGETGNQIAIPGGEAAGQIGGGGFGGGQGGGGGVGGAGGGGGGVGGGGQGGGRGGNANLTGGQGLVGESIDFVSYDPTDNSLVVRGTEEDLDQLQKYINLFDVVPRQVLIKVEFITTTDSISKSFGTEFLYNRGTVFAGTVPGAFVRNSDPVFLNYASGNVTARLRAFLSEGGGKVVNAPIIRTLNNQPAVVNSSVTTYIFITQQTAVSGAGIITTASPVPLTVQTSLAVAPRINDDNTITMYLTPTVGNFVGTSVGPGGTQIPNPVVQNIRVVARVRNGETIVLGGLTTKSDDNSVLRVPILSELPIIGQFFRTYQRNRTNNELLIFVTPTIVDEDTTGNPGGP